MYRLLVAAVIITFALCSVWLLKSNQWTYSTLFKFLKAEIFRFNQLMLIKIEPFKALRKVLYRITALLFLILVISGFFPVLIFGQSLSGSLLIVHVTTAPIFVLFFTLSLLFNAHSQQFNLNDWNYVSQAETEQKLSMRHRLVFWRKVCFWLFAVISLPAILSVIISMYPLFGTGWQVAMLNLHQFSVLVLLIVSMFYLKSKYLSAAA